jgi:uncharacterized protein
LKRKLADRLTWRRIVQKRFAVQYVDTEEFVGYVSLLCLDEVAEPLWLELAGQRVCVVDNGFTWLQQFPVGAYHAVTTIFDNEGSIVEWYIDICKQHGITPEGIPWYDDLYLDLGVFPSGQINVLDADELDDVLRREIISRADYELAWRETERLLQEIQQGTFSILSLGTQHREALLRVVKPASTGF